MTKLSPSILAADPLRLGQAARMAALSDGAIVGSAIVKLMEQHGTDAVPHVADYVRTMKRAVRGVCPALSENTSSKGGSSHV